MSIESTVLKVAKSARSASLELAALGSRVKDSALLRMADGLLRGGDLIKEANRRDLDGAEAQGLSSGDGGPPHHQR